MKNGPMSRGSTASHQFSNNACPQKSPCLICNIRRHLYPVMDAPWSAVSAASATVSQRARKLFRYKRELYVG